MIPMLTGMLAGGGTAPADPYFANVVSLLNMEGADGSTTFTDATGKVWTSRGDAQIDTSLGYSAGYFDGDGDYLTTPAHADWSFGSGAWTIDGYFMMPADPAVEVNVFARWGSDGTNQAWLLGFNPSRKIFMITSGNGSYSATFDLQSPSNALPAPGQLFHAAWCFDPSTAKNYIYVHGAKVAEGPSTSIFGSSRGVSLAANNDAANALAGYVRVIRTTKGVCRYPGGTSFTPPPPDFPTS